MVRVRTSRGAVAAVFGLGVVCAAGCVRSGPSTDTVVFRMMSETSADVGVLVVVRGETDTRWTLSNESLMGKGTPELLRSGVVEGASFDAIAEEVGSRWPRLDAGESGVGAWRVEARLMGGGVVVSEHVRTVGEEAGPRAALPTSDAFRAIWDAASRIPKMYWYRDLGPLPSEGRGGMQRLVND